MNGEDIYVLRPELVWPFEVTVDNMHQVNEWPVWLVQPYQVALAGGEDTPFATSPEGLLFEDELVTPGKVFVLDEHGVVFLMDPDHFHETFMAAGAMTDDGEIRVTIGQDDEEDYFACTACDLDWDDCECEEGDES